MAAVELIVGEVRPFLNNEHAQAYFAIAIIGAFAYGALNLIVGIKDLF